MTINELVEALKSSQGFVLFASYVVKKEDTMELQHQYLRQQFVPEDLEKAFAEFKGMVSRDIAESGANLIKSAESIANMKSPALKVEEAEFRKPEE